jgi:hypothetical protein
MLEFVAILFCQCSERAFVFMFVVCASYQLCSAQLFYTLTCAGSQNSCADHYMAKVLIGIYIMEFGFFVVTSVFGCRNGLI